MNKLFSVLTAAFLAGGCTLVLNGQPVVQIGPDFLGPDARVVIMNATDLAADVTLDNGKRRFVNAGRGLRLDVYAMGQYTTERAFVVRLCVPTPDEKQCSSYVGIPLTGTIQASNWHRTSRTFIIQKTGARSGYEMVSR